MGQGSDLINSSKRQQNSKLVKETVLPTQARRSLGQENKLKAKCYVSQANGDLPCRLRQHVNNASLFRQKIPVKQSVKAKATKDDELVKYMSNLPGYLQRMETGENIQDKALNVGVLNWAHLENWKSTQKFIPEMYVNCSSSTSCNLSTKTTRRSSTFPSSVSDETHAHHRAHQDSLCSNFRSSHSKGISQGTKPSTRNDIHFQDYEKTSNSGLDGQERVLQTYKSSGMTNSDAILEKGNRKDLDHIISKSGNMLPDLRYGFPIRIEGNDNGGHVQVKTRVDEMQEPDIKRKVLDRKTTSRIGSSSSKLRSYDGSCGLEAKMNVGMVNTRKRSEKLPEPSVDVSPQREPTKKNIVVLLPRKVSSNSSLRTPRTSLDETLAEADSNNSPDGFSHNKVHSADIHHEIPRSYPLPSRAETSTEPHNKVYTVIKTPDEEPSSGACDASAFFHKMPSRPSTSEQAESNCVKSTNGIDLEASEMLEQETAKLVDRKGRHSSPNRQFSFRLGRMTRSSSYKESSAPLQLSSTYVSVKSGPVSASLDGSNREKASGHNRARSSPLRRILDPLLKSKGSNPLNSAETDQLLKGSLKSFSLKAINAIESFQNGKHDTSSIQALLHLTFRNGLPLFKFLVSGNSSILAAPVKNLTLPGKSDSGCNYIFYTIDEVKKRNATWINLGNKGKTCGYVYNVIGQMKVNSSSYFHLTGETSGNKHVEKQCVLFGAELRQPDETPPKFMSTRELAAVVVRAPGENSSNERRQSDDKDDGLKQKGFSGHPHNECSFKVGETEHSPSVTIILPDGVHGLSNNGGPSPLIDRWKSGGSCDCGGWDAGCKLRILSNENHVCKITRTSEDWPATDQFQLFIQGGAQQDQPVFSLARIEKGKYSVEFSPSISLLQSFFICVTIISRQKSSDLVQAGNQREEFQEPRDGDDGTKKIPATVLGEAPLKYAPGPPLSPAGRV